MREEIGKMELDFSGVKGSADEVATSLERVAAAARAAKAALDAINGDHGGVSIAVCGQIAKVEIQPLGAVVNPHDPGAAAIATLEAMGYTHDGGVEWKPPLGKAPLWVTMPERNAGLARMMAAINAIHQSSKRTAACPEPSPERAMDLLKLVAEIQIEAKKRGIIIELER